MIMVFGSATNIIYTIIWVEVKKMRFCDKLLNLRKKNNFSQEQLAERLGVSRQSVSKWESGGTYPDMEKMILLCEILNCTLNELMDDGIIDDGNKEISRFHFGDWMHDFFKYITNTYNMFCNMKFKDKIKCLLEMIFIGFIIWIFGLIVFSIFNSLIFDLFLNIPKVGYIIDAVFEKVLTLILFVLGGALFLHLFKIRYLDYFVTIEDKNVNNQVVEAPVFEGETSNVLGNRKQEKIIIRDPKHSSFSFFDGLAKVVVFGIKIFAFFLGLTFVFAFIGFVFTLGLTGLMLKYGVIFLGFFLFVLGLVVISYLIVKYIYDFIFDRKHHYKGGFIVLISSFVVIGIGMAISFNEYIGFECLKDNSDLEYVTDTLNIDFNSDTRIYNYNDVVIDNKLDNVKVEVKHLKNVDFSYKTSNDLDYSDYYYFYNEGDFFDNFNLLLSDLKNKKIRDYSSFYEMEVKLYLSYDNYKKLIKNNSYE